MGKRPPIAPAGALERLSAQTPRSGASLPRRFASHSPLSRVPFASLACHVDDDVLAANDETFTLETKTTAPLVPTTEITAGDNVFGDAGGEESTPIDDSLLELLSGACCEA